MLVICIIISTQLSPLSAIPLWASHSVGQTYDFRR